MRFLLTNDDGIRATGLATLERALEGLATIDVVAPDRERSASGHSLTLEHPLRVAQLDAHHWAVSGTPTDAVLLAIEKLLPERPDWVISGINHGPNMARGRDLLRHRLGGDRGRHPGQFRPSPSRSPGEASCCSTSRPDRAPGGRTRGAAFGWRAINS